MLYDYQCNNENCNIIWEDVKQSIHDKPKKKCPKCKCLSLERIITGGIGISIIKEPTTIGQLADKNYKKNASKIQEEKHKKKENSKQEETIYDGGVTRRQIQKMTPKQKEKYIKKGET